MSIEKEWSTVETLEPKNYRNVAAALFGVLQTLGDVHEALLTRLGRDNMLTIQAKKAHNQVATFENAVLVVMAAEPFDIPDIKTYAGPGSDEGDA